MKQHTKSATFLNKILCGDCYEVLKKIPSQSVDCAIIDPPYFLGMTHNGQKGNFLDLSIAKPFFNQVFTELKRILKPVGEIYVFCDWRSDIFFQPILDEVFTVRNKLIWHKGFGRISQYYAFSYECMLFAFNEKPKKNHCVSNIIEAKGFANGAIKTNGDKQHETQKPVEIIEKLILEATNKGDTVLDCFFGSGTTGVAAKKLGRNFIGIEQSEKYCKIAQKRIDTI